MAEAEAARVKEESAAAVAVATSAKKAAEKARDQAGEAAHAAVSAETEECIRCALGFCVLRSVSGASTTSGFNKVI